MAKRTKTKKIQMKSGDFLLTILVLALVVFGIIMVFSASYYSSISETGDPYTYLKDNIMWALLGAGLMLVTALLDYHIYEKLAPVFLVTSIVLLCLLFTPLGITRNNATRWLGVGGFTLMPGEVAKICAILFVAWFLSRDSKRIRSFTKGVLPLLLLCGVYFILIIKQPNLSTAITICAIIIGMMFVAGLNIMYLISIGLLGGGGVLGLVLMDEDGYWMKRITSFLDPFQDPLGSGWQVIQSLLALGSGGLFGVGLGNSIQKTLYLPEPQNDFIFAIIGEELGFFGCLLLMCCYIILIWRGCHIALNAPDLFGTLIASGITIMLAVQVILNIAVVTSSMPPTGITLPFVSYGGNALLLFMGSFGILLNISRHSAV
ncbi:MAG TPA: putative lipid II flippase FtsW [Bacillota bacterium]|jgi:cell division protein FtsW|nr:putative lipid II flippase FtsW [Clostridiales bacterium UBA9856]HOA42167.1 putative lipid II flippase FtsW [Bacillota bacterium]HPZ59875.1 putative lipid II flippase FtsW [Bacillota bacterium]HQC83151.1 putative lipid II flippase FtsW [Bacillota bacterium]